MPSGHPRATRLTEVDHFARPHPLTPETWYQFINADEARDGHGVSDLMIKLQTAHREGRHIRYVVAGHMGCGKSTEMQRVAAQVADHYEPIISRVAERYSLPTLEYRQVLFHCADLLVEKALATGIEMSQDELESLLGWFDERSLEDTKSRGYQFDVEGGANVKLQAGYNFFDIFKAASEMFAGFRGKIFSGGTTKETVTRHIEERLDGLMRQMERIVAAIERKIAPRRLLLILEDLDKVEQLAQARSLFRDHRLQLLSIPCSMILTFPIRLWYEPDGGVERYEDHYLLPMIPVAKAPPSLDFSDSDLERKAQTGRATLDAILDQRIERHLIDDGARTLLIEKSGGVIRDLLEMVRRGASDAIYRNKDRIDVSHARAAVRSLRDEYSRRLAPPSEGTPVITLGDINEALGTVTDWPRREPVQSHAFRLLLQNLCILEYNGDRWHDVHPVVADYLRIREDEEQRRGGAK